MPKFSFFKDKKEKERTNPKPKPQGYTPPKIGRPRIWDTADELQLGIDFYFDTLEGPPTITGLTLYLGYASKQGLDDACALGKDFSITVKRAKLRIENFAEQQLLTRDKPTGAIFWLKNSGWSDKREIEHSGVIDIKQLSPEEEEKRIEELLKKRDAPK